MRDYSGTDDSRKGAPATTVGLLEAEVCVRENQHVNLKQTGVCVSRRAKTCKPDCWCTEEVLRCAEDVGRWCPQIKVSSHC